MDRVVIWVVGIALGFLIGMAYTFGGCQSWGGCDYPNAPHRTDTPPARYR